MGFFQGMPGTAGAQGETGLQGPKGMQGSTGYRGSYGQFGEDVSNNNNLTLFHRRNALNCCEWAQYFVCLEDFV